MNDAPSQHEIWATGFVEREWIGQEPRAERAAGYTRYVRGDLYEAVVGELNAQRRHWSSHPTWTIEGYRWMKKHCEMQEPAPRWYINEGHVRAYRDVGGRPETLDPEAWLERQR